MLNLRFLGDVEVVRGGERLALPPSKKTRALLAYLAVTGRPHRRERLCTLLWDIPDDPRGALRWSLSKLRALVDDPPTVRIAANRETVAFNGTGAHVDLTAIRAQVAGGLDALPTETLAALAGAFRGEFLEGLDLPDLHDFQAWCVAEREEARRLHAGILSGLVDRFAGDPHAALPHARLLTQIDPFSEPARASLLRLLVAAGRRSEAEQQFDVAMRFLKELGGGASAELARLWRTLREPSASESARALGTSDSVPAPRIVTATEQPDRKMAAGSTGLVGRQAEWGQLLAALDTAHRQSRELVVLLTGEPGLGKSRLLAELVEAVEDRGGTVLAGSAYEAERGRPYGPWTDVLRRLPAALLGRSTDPAPLLPELAHQQDAASSRDRLFGAVAEVVAAAAADAPPVLLVFDDVHWCDDASAALLHYVVRTNRQRPLLVALAAREGELPDNPAMLGVLRSLRHDRLLHELALKPLSPGDTRDIVRNIAPEVDAGRVFAESGGNPLFALEIARALRDRPDDVPRSLSELVRDRIERLPAGAAEALRWAAVLGPSFTIGRLMKLMPSDPDELMTALETLERHALIRAAEGGAGDGGAYGFAHDLVHRAVYTALSEPRRRMMHLRIAKALQDARDSDETVAADIAHHAVRGGDAAMAAHACVTAGHQYLRVFANTEADGLARRGLHYAEQLRDPEQVKLVLELMRIRLAARRPERPEELMRTLEALAERALDHGCLEHARLAFYMLSYLRWEGGLWSEAQRDTLRAELVSRTADETQRILAMAETARCLAMLERDLGQAEALLLEAHALSQRLGVEPDAISDATGMLRLHQGKLDEAARLFRHARVVARRDGNRVSEFHALEHLVVLEIQRENFAEACSLCGELVSIGEKLREGSEAPFGRAMSALCRYAHGDETALDALEEALQALRVADAKYRLAVALTHASECDLRRGVAERARIRAEEALQMATLLDRPSDMALAHLALARAAAALQDRDKMRDHILALEALSQRGISAHAQSGVETLMTEQITAA